MNIDLRERKLILAGKKFSQRKYIGFLSYPFKGRSAIGHNKQILSRKHFFEGINRTIDNLLIVHQMKLHLSLMYKKT